MVHLIALAKQNFGFSKIGLAIVIYAISERYIQWKNGKY